MSILYVVEEIEIVCLLFLLLYFLLVKVMFTRLFLFIVALDSLDVVAVVVFVDFFNDFDNVFLN